MSNNNHLVSIIVPVYKVEQYLPTCIESIQHQTYHNWELILVDDGSPDKSGEICEKYAEIDDRIRVIHQSNGGQAAARNHGLDLMKGRYVAFLDSDDFWHKDYLSHLLGLLYQYDADIVHCTYIWGHDNVFPEQPKKEEIIRVVSGKEALYKDVCDVLVWGKIYKAHLFDGIRMPVGVHNEDDCTTWKVSYRARKLVHTSRPLVYHVLNDAGLTAQGTRKLDLAYQQAFEDRQETFSKDQDIDLINWNLFKWNKSILLSYGNEWATRDQRENLKEIFNENFTQLRKLSMIPFHWRLIFVIFQYCPLMVSTVTLRLKDIVRYHTFRRFSKDKKADE